jgi:uncharacterized protein (DUF4415 family)
MSNIARRFGLIAAGTRMKGPVISDAAMSEIKKSNKVRIPRPAVSPPVAEIPQETGGKRVPVLIKMKAHVHAAWKGSGDGWIKRINDLLEEKMPGV